MRPVGALAPAVFFALLNSRIQIRIQRRAAPASASITHACRRPDRNQHSERHLQPKKLDPRLTARHRAYRTAVETDGPDTHEAQASVRVAVIFEGDVARLASAGMLVRSVYGPVAYGDVRMSDLDRLADLPEVKRIERET